MGETKWTPGPWFVGPVQRGVRVIGYAHGTVARVHGSRLSLMDNDAALVAESPNLYAELENTTSLLRAYAGHVQDGIVDVALADADRALARARGETK